MNVILVINAGSSSIKFRLFQDNDALPLVFKGQVDSVGVQASFRVEPSVGEPLIDRSGIDLHSHDHALAHILDWLAEQDDSFRLTAVGHRVVHGGATFHRATVIDNDVIEKLERLAPLAPLHQPHNLAGVRGVAKQNPGIFQVACFDTAFHARQDMLAQSFALPRSYYQKGVRRYGFHGLSYEYICQRIHVLAPRLASGRMIVAHLGNGASLCAINNGKSVDSTMSFTALDGLPMGTRCGSLDPGVLLYMMQNEALSADEIENILYQRSGLLGLSGISNDVRTLLANESETAKFALDYFVYRIVTEIGALSAILGGLDGVIFTAGIGENAVPVRQAVCEKLAHMGIVLDEKANRDCDHDACISTVNSAISVWVVRTNEERMIARHTQALREGG